MDLPGLDNEKIVLDVRNKKELTLGKFKQSIHVSVDE